MEINISWEKLTAEERIERAVDVTGREVMATSSFGIQSAVLLHLIHRVYPKMPIVFIDTGFLFDETYQYAERLVKMWGLDLHTYKAERNDSVESESGETVDLEEYNSIHKVEPYTGPLMSCRRNAGFRGCGGFSHPRGGISQSVRRTSVW